MKIDHTLLAGTGFLVAVILSGCGGQPLPADLPKLYPTVITIVQEGKPLEAALVTMVNMDPTSQWGCAARTDALGKAKMQTNGMYVGAPAGTYKVTVVKQEFEQQENPYADAPNQQEDPDAYQRWYSANYSRIMMGAKNSSAHDLVDPQYGNMSTTTLEITIPTDKNQLTFDVGKAVYVPHH